MGIAQIEANGRRQTGTILLETLLSLPLFMVLLGGVLWLGELSYSRHALLSGDRLAAWSLRSVPAAEVADRVRELLWKGEADYVPGDSQSGVFDAHRGQSLEVKLGEEEQGDPVADGWWARSFAYASCPEQRAPDWVSGWLRANVFADQAEVGGGGPTPAAFTDEKLTVRDLLGRTDAGASSEADRALAARTAIADGYPTAGHVLLVRRREGAAVAARAAFAVEVSLDGSGSDTCTADWGLESDWDSLFGGRRTEVVTEDDFMPLAEAPSI